MTPQRIQLSRARGWRMPPNTVKVDRTTPWGNPFIVGAQGNAAQCVYFFAMLLTGHILLDSRECIERQEAMLAFLKLETPWYARLRGKNLACWCRIGQPCHADLLLDLANRSRRRPRPPLDVNGFLARYGWRIERGEAVRLAREGQA